MLCLKNVKYVFLKSELGLLKLLILLDNISIIDLELEFKLEFELDVGLKFCML